MTTTMTAGDTVLVQSAMGEWQGTVVRVTRRWVTVSENGRVDSYPRGDVRRVG